MIGWNGEEPMNLKKGDKRLSFRRFFTFYYGYVQL